MCRVLNDRQVEYEGKPWSLSGLARYLTKAKNCIPGPHYFKYKGEWLNDIRARLGVYKITRKLFISSLSPLDRARLEDLLQMHGGNVLLAYRY